MSNPMHANSYGTAITSSDVRDEYRSASSTLLVRRTSVLTFVVLAVWSSAAIAVESLEDLSARMKIDVMAAGLMSGDPTTLSSLPTKGYKDGLAGFLRQYHLYPNPDYSFTSCGDGALVAPPTGKPGCIVSVKLARKNADGSFRDTGVRIEYGVGPGSKSFQANNSAYAEHAISGDGLLQAQFQRP